MVEGIAFASVPVSKKRVGAYLLPLHNLYKSFQDEFCFRDSEVIGVDVYWKCDARVDAVFQRGVLNEMAYSSDSIPRSATAKLQCTWVRC